MGVGGGALRRIWGVEGVNTPFHAAIELLSRGMCSRCTVLQEGEGSDAAEVDPSYTLLSIWTTLPWSSIHT